MLKIQTTFYDKSYTRLITFLFLITSFHSIIKAQNNSDLYDYNQDGTLNILVIGTNNSVEGSEAFSPNFIAFELDQILGNDPLLEDDYNVVAEDIYKSKNVTLGLGGGGTEYTWTHYSHSLLQYYYWPEDQEQRMEYLMGNGEYDWDYVFIAADPYIISNVPGFYALGVSKLAAKIREGNAQPILIQMWSNQTNGRDVSHFEEFTYRTAAGLVSPIETVPAGQAWCSLPENKKDNSTIHPTPNGAFLTASALYAHIFERSASTSDYIYDNEIADHALATLDIESNRSHFSGINTFLSPFKACNTPDEVISYNHTGTSSENGIRAGLTWVFDKSTRIFQNGGEAIINFNYGRANTNFEPNKRYKIDPSRFNYSFGFPMQDHGNHGNTSLLYGIDKRLSGTTNDTDLGTAQYMIQQNELPHGRAIPVRALYAQMKEAIQDQSAYRDSWHMHRNLDKSIAAFMYTLLTGSCALVEEPQDQSSDEWGTWMSQKIGHQTAWQMMYLYEDLPDCNLLVDNDLDGFNALVDCNDEEDSINPEQSEIPYNGVDDDCNTATSDDDFDQDGYAIDEDCDDQNANINPGQSEIPYNGIDEDCNAMTFDDDLDQDGFLLADDCDDENPNVNPNQNELVYNGIDDDCNAMTFDDDLDQDGFLLEDDCDDENADINPEAEEIPNNGIDEDCDGSDLITSTQEIETVNFQIHPNPVSQFLYISSDYEKEYEIRIINTLGQELMISRSKQKIDLSNLESGLLLLEVQDVQRRWTKTFKVLKR